MQDKNENKSTNYSNYSEKSLLKSMLDNTPENIVLIDENYRVLCYNAVLKKTLEQFHGKSIKVGDDYRDFVVTHLLSNFIEAHAIALKGELIDVDLETMGSGFSKWFRYKFAPVYENDKELIGVVISTVDIDDKKRSELELVRLKNSFELMTNHIGEGVLLFDKECRLILFNDEASKNVFANTGKQIYVGADFMEFTYPGTEEYFAANFKTVLSGNTFSDYVQILNEHKEPFWYKYLMSPVYDEERQNVIGVTIISQNVQDMKLSELALKKSNRELRLLTEINDIILSSGSQPELLDKVSEAIVNQGGYALCWMAFPPMVDDIENWVIKKHVFGASQYVKQLKLSYSNPDHVKGPTIMALKTLKTIISNELSTTPFFRPLKNLIKKYGLASSIALPVLINEFEFAALNIYSSETNAFDEAEVHTLERICKNISLALWQLRTQKEKNDARTNLLERVKELRTIYNVNSILQADEGELNKTLESIVALIPSGWRFVEHCVARILFDGQEYRSASFIKTVFKQTASFTTYDGKTGSIEVYYTVGKPMSDEGPFSKEERDLINTLAEMISLAYNKNSIFRELKNSQNKLETIINNTDTGYLMLDADFRVIYVNEPFKVAYARAANIEVAVGENFAAILAREKRENDLAKLSLVFSSKQVIKYETGFDNSGMRRYFSLAIFPLKSELEITIGACIAVNEITERKSREQEMEEQRLKLIDSLKLNTQIIQTADEFFYVATVKNECIEEAVITFVSQQVKPILGLNPRLLMGKRGWIDIIHPEDKKIMENALQELTLSKKPVRLSYRINDSRSNSSRWIEEYLCPLLDDNGAIIEIYGSVRDVDERVKTLLRIETEKKQSFEFQSRLFSSQLNPHFIYNTLNSFQYFILEGDIEKSLNYISEFSTLMRAVLDNSMHKFISLEVEFDFLRHFVKISEQRLLSPLNFTIDIDPQIEISEVMIPPLLLQPFVENSLIHGLSSVDYDPELFIGVSQIGNKIQCVIRDNGVGREKAQENKNLKLPHRSYAMGIIKSRIEILNEITNYEFEVEISDLKNNHNRATGTEVVIRFNSTKDEF